MGAGVPPPSLQIFEMIPGVRLLTGFHASHDLVSHPFVNNPWFHLYDENIFARHFESNLWACCMLLKIQWQNAMGGGGGGTCKQVCDSE